MDVGDGSQSDIVGDVIGPVDAIVDMGLPRSQKTGKSGTGSASYYAGKKGGQAFRPDVSWMSGRKA